MFRRLIYANNTEFVGTDHAMSHPLELIDKLEIGFTWTTYRFFVHVANPFDIFFLAKV